MIACDSCRGKSEAKVYRIVINQSNNAGEFLAKTQQFGQSQKLEGLSIIKHLCDECWENFKKSILTPFYVN